MVFLLLTWWGCWRRMPSFSTGGPSSRPSAHGSSGWIPRGCGRAGPPAWTGTSWRSGPPSCSVSIPLSACCKRTSCLLHFICMQYLPKTWAFTTQTRRCRPLASDFSVSCWICAWLIFLAHWKTFYRKLSLMINGCHVNRRCGICKWLCLWCAARSPVRYHMGGFSTSWIQKRGRLIWKGFLGVCARESVCYSGN